MTTLARPPITPQLADGKVVEVLLSEGQKCIELTYGLPGLVGAFTELRAGLGDDVVREAGRSR